MGLFGVYVAYLGSMWLNLGSMWLIEKSLTAYMKANDGSLPHNFKMSLIPDIVPDSDFSISEADIDKAVRRVRRQLVV